MALGRATGQDRGGFYSYTILENAIGAKITNADRTHSEWQRRELGDRVWLGDLSRYDGSAYMVVARWIPGKALVLVTPADSERILAGELADQGVWLFLVEPISAKSCRLIATTLTGPGLSTKGKLANYLFWEPAHFVMERGMLRGIKSRVEASVSVSEPTRCRMEACCARFGKRA